MKAIGALMVISAAFCMGVNEFFKAKRRIATLEELLSFVRSVMTEIRYLAVPVDEMLDTMDERGRLPEVIAEYNSGSVYEKYGLTHNDIKQLDAFISNLGRSDTQGEIANCGYYETQLEYDLDKLRRDFEKKGKMYLILGLTAGIAAVLPVI